MAVNRFWNQSPVAEYKPMSMQEMSYAPQMMYQREKDLTGQVDAMNESAATLKTMLGDKAATTDKYNQQYQDMVNIISKQGATPQALEKAKSLRKTFIEEVKPQEEFAKQRQVMYGQWLKDKSDPSKIIIGENPLNVGYNDWFKTKMLQPHQVADRDKLIAYGAKMGNEWATGNTKEVVNKYGQLEVHKGFKTSAEAMNAYQNDPKFKEWVDSQVGLVAKGQNIDPSNPEVADAIRGGIMSSTVGGMQLHNLPSEYLKGMFSGEKAQPSEGFSFIGFTPTARPADKPDEALINSPAGKQAINAQIKAELGQYGVSTLEDLDAKINSITDKTEYNTSKIQKDYAARLASGADPRSIATGVIAENQPGVNSQKKLKDELIAKRESIIGKLKSNPDYATDLSIWHEPSTLRMVSKELRDMSEDVSKDLSEGVQRNIADYGSGKKTTYGGVSPDYRDSLVEFNKNEDPDKKMILKDVRVNAIPDRQSGVIRGSGYPTAVFDLYWKDGKTPKHKEVVMHLPQNEMNKIFSLSKNLSRYGNANEQQMLNDLIYASEEYYKSERDANQPKQ